jgi:hypothetical protein
VIASRVTGNHTKEIAMKNRQMVFKWFTIICTLLLIFCACSQPEGNKPIPEDNNSNPGGNKIIELPLPQKFQAESYKGNNNDRIKYSYTYNGYDYYYIYLGELKNIPMFYRNARYYAGNTEWTYEFSTVDIKEDNIRSTVENSRQEAIGVVKEHTYSTTDGGKISAEIGANVEIKKIFDISGKVAAEYSWSKYTSDTKTNSTLITTSLTETLEHAVTHTFQTMESDRWVFTSVDRAGYYRWTLFSASDVYLYVIRDSQDGGIYYEFREYVIPNAYFWSMDYSETPSFRKSDATGFELDISILDNLRKPKLDLADTGVQYYTIEYNANGGSGTMGSAIHFYGEAQNLKRNVFVPPEGYSFAGWAISSAATVAEFTDGQDVLNLTSVKKGTVTLYAVWSLVDVIMERTIARGRTMSIAIPSNITRAVIRGEDGVTYNNAEIIVAERALPLTIELHNVNAVGRYGSDGAHGSNGENGRPVIYMGNYVRVPNLTIASYGTENRLDGGKGGNGGEGNSNSTGKTGGNGGAAILADRITIIGDAKIILKGGDGGAGGRGGDMGVSFNATDGGNGGNGGAAIDANNIANNLVGIVYALRSAGGAAGAVWRGLTGLAFIGGSNGAAGAQGVQFTSTLNPSGIVRDQL